MGVSSYYEFVVTLFGWVLYDNLYQVLAGSGIVYIPFLIMLFSHIISSRKAGDDEGFAAIQSLKKIETDLIVMVIVLALCVIPISDVSISEMRLAKPELDCHSTAEVIDGDDTGTTFDRTLQTLDGQTGRIPIWWAVMHIVSKSITSASIASIPCSYDLGAVETRLADDDIEDPALRKELEDFINDCYRPSKSLFIRENGAAITTEQADEAGWIGSQYFQDTAGYYDTFYSQLPRADWPYLASRDAGFEADQVSGGHPACSDWWANGAHGLRTRVLDSLETHNKDDFVYRVDSILGYLNPLASDTENEDTLLRKYLAIQAAGDFYNGATGTMATSYSVSLTDQMKSDWNTGGGFGVLTANGTAVIKDAVAVTAAAIGGMISLPGALAEGEMIREGVSIFQGILLLMFILLLPFLQVFGLFRPSMVLTLSVIYFGMHFFSFLWGVAFWLDNHLLAAIVDGSVFAPIANPTQAMIVVWVQRFFYIFFPMIFMTAMGWVGVNVGKLGAEFSGMTGKASEPGKKGGDKVAQFSTSKGSKA